MRQPFWKIKHDFLCLKVIGMLNDDKYNANDIYKEIRALMDFTTLENIEKYDIMEKRKWVTINGRPVYIRDNSGKSKIENAFRNGVNSKSSKEIVNTVIEHHESLGEFTPAGMKKFLENCGYDVKPLGSKSSLQGQRFEDGGGYRISFGGDGYFQYHPKKASHHKDAYWKVGNGERGLHRYEMDGRIKND